MTSFKKILFKIGFVLLSLGLISLLISLVICFKEFLCLALILLFVVSVALALAWFLLYSLWEAGEAVWQEYFGD